MLFSIVLGRAYEAVSCFSSASQCSAGTEAPCGTRGSLHPIWMFWGTKGAGEREGGTEMGGEQGAPAWCLFHSYF